VCPYRQELKSVERPPRIEPAGATEFDERLSTMFPRGSDSSQLGEALRKMNFMIEGTCETDASIKFARFDQAGLGNYLFPLTAIVYWKVDSQGKVVWTKGSISFTGL
jgi:hypothetical protein